MAQTLSDPQTKKLAEMIHGIRIAMLSTVDTDGTLRSRPMATQATDFEGELWFFTKASSHKVKEIDHDHRVNLSYSNPEKNHYVSISGLARLVRDQEKARQLWNPLYKTWFPQGVDDPDLRLLRVSPQQAEYWDATSSTMVQLTSE